MKFNIKKILRNVVAAVAICLAASATMVAQSNTTDEGVIINGVKWATRNLDVGGTFVESAEDFGALFQWGRNADGHESRTSATTDVPSDTDTPGHGDFIIYSDDLEGYNRRFDWRDPQNDALWNSGTDSAPIKADNDPSPAGWRVPTLAEIAALADKTKVSVARITQNDIVGLLFTDLENDNTLFLPCAGYRTPRDEFGGGDPYAQIGVYWSGSSTPYDDPHIARQAYMLHNGGTSSEWRGYGYSIRPVAENFNGGINDITADTEKSVTGYYDILGRQLKAEPTKGFYIIRYSNGTSKKVVR